MSQDFEKTICPAGFAGGYSNPFIEALPSTLEQSKSWRSFTYRNTPEGLTPRQQHELDVQQILKEINP